MPINIASNFNLGAALPLDSRTVAADTTARDAIPDGQRYEGLAVYVLSEEQTYQLRGGITNGDWQAGDSSWFNPGITIAGTPAAPEFSLGLHTEASTMTYSLLTTPASDILIICAEADKANDWIGGTFPPSGFPTVFMVSKDLGDDTKGFGIAWSGDPGFTIPTEMKLEVFNMSPVTPDDGVALRFGAAFAGIHGGDVKIYTGGFDTSTITDLTADNGIFKVYIGQADDPKFAVSTKGVSIDNQKAQITVYEETPNPLIGFDVRSGTVTLDHDDATMAYIAGTSLGDPFSCAKTLMTIGTIFGDITGQNKVVYGTPSGEQDANVWQVYGQLPNLEDGGSVDVENITGIAFSTPQGSLYVGDGTKTVNNIWVANFGGGQVTAGTGLTTIGNAATLFVGFPLTAGDNNVTFSNEPNSLWVIDGLSNIEGRLELNMHSYRYEGFNAGADERVYFHVKYPNAISWDGSADISMQRFNVVDAPTCSVNGSGGEEIEFGINFAIDGGPSGTEVSTSIALSVGETTNSTKIKTGGSAWQVVTNHPVLDTDVSNIGSVAALVAGSPRPTCLGDSNGTIDNVSCAQFSGGNFITNGTKTVSSAMTVYINGAPTFGEGFTLSNEAYSLYVSTGKSWFGDCVQIKPYEDSPNQALWVQGANYTFLDQMGGSEQMDVYFDLHRTIQFLPYDVPLQRQFVVTSPHIYCSPNGDASKSFDFSALVHFQGAPDGDSLMTVGLLIGDIEVQQPMFMSQKASITQQMILMPNIDSSTLEIDNIYGLHLTSYSGLGDSANLGGQTANLGELCAIKINSITYEGSANTRTVTGEVASLYIEGPPVAGSHVAFSGTPYSIHVAAGATRLDGHLYAYGGITYKATTVSGEGPYAVAATDESLHITYAPAITINLPAVSSVGSGRRLYIHDSRYNASVNNITIHPDGTDKIGNVNADWLMVTDGQSICLEACSTTNDWKVVFS